MSEVITRTVSLDGMEMSFELGRLAKQASASVLAKAGDTAVLVTVCVGEPNESIDYFPLFVEYIEKMYASGLISSSRFVKRERHPGQDATLKARAIDRSIRPLFPEDFKNSVQIIVTVLSYDEEYDPFVLAVNAVSLALMISDIPFAGPVACVRVGLEEGDFKVLAKAENGREKIADLDLVVSATDDSVVMVEAAANEIDEEKVIQALEFALSKEKPLLDMQRELQKEVGKEKLEYESAALPEELMEALEEEVGSEIEGVLYMGSKEETNEQMEKVKERVFEKFEGEYSKSQMQNGLTELIKKAFRAGLLREGKRPDGRKLDEVRSLTIEVGALPRTHGSGLFQRGETQILSIATLGSGRLEQYIEGLEGEETQRYMHHYNFPPFSTGETGRYNYYPGRREVGHGALGEKALLPVIPSQEVFPYTIRVVSEVLAANGSTSMAATCGSTMALMDAGVPIKRPVSGIAVGLVHDAETGKNVILTDIAGFEDHFGDMDFKVTGTENGITALQMDNKIKAVSIETLTEALEQGKKARLFVLEEMLKVIPKPREALSKYAPKIEVLQIDKSKIGDLIGPGGKVIKGIIEETGAEIDIQDDGTVAISAVDDESRRLAKEKIEAITLVPEVGKVYEGTVDRVMPYGAFVNITPGVSGLVHVSELAEGFVKDPSKVVKEGQVVKVKVVGVDDEGRFRFSLKQAKVAAGNKEQDSIPRSHS